MQKKLIKVLFIHQVGCRGGAGTMLANIIASIDKNSFEPIVVCPQGDGNGQLVAAGAEVRISPRPIYQFLHYTGYSPAIWNPHFIRHAYMLWRDRTFWENYIRESGAHIVCLNAMTIAPMALSARRAGAKVLCIVQETSVHGLLGFRTAWLTRILSSWMDAVVFISNFDRIKFNCQAPIVEVIPNWVNLNDFDRASSRKQARLELDVPDDTRVILMMGGIDRLKGTLQLVEAAALLSDAVDFIVIVAGYSNPPDISSAGVLTRVRTYVRRKLGFDYRQKVLRVIEKNGLTSRIRFIGMQSNVARLYAAADVLAFPATKPHQARPVLEAGAMAKPVVVPDFSQILEFVTDGYNGITYKQGDVRSLADALRILLADSGLATTIGENNYSNTCAQNDEAKNSARFKHVFDRLAAMCSYDK